MCLFRKKTVAEKVENDRELIAVNSKAIEALVVLAQNNFELIKSLKEVQEQLKYLTPSNNSKVVGCDKVISNKIGDLRIALIKSNVEIAKAEDLIIDIKLAIADRNTNV